MTYEAAVRYLMSLLGDIRGANFGLSRMQRLMEALGHPERSFRTVHIAGTNGKGSTAALNSSSLESRPSILSRSLKRTKWGEV